MRAVSLMICAFALGPVPAFAGLAQDEMNAVIAKLDLERTRSEAHARCVQDVPATIEWLRDPVVEHYCLLRYGAPRQFGLFLGVRLSVELEQVGKSAQSGVIEALLDVQDHSRDETARR